MPGAGPITRVAVAGQLFLIGAPQHIPGFADVLPHFPHLN